MLAQYLVRLICFQSIILLDELLHPLLALFVFLVSKSICNTPYDIQFLLDFVLTEMILLDADARRTPPPSPLPRHTCIKKHPLWHSLPIGDTVDHRRLQLHALPVTDIQRRHMLKVRVVPNPQSRYSSLQSEK
jgi:hypothetical protein